jgi:hypothetical protein
MARDCETVNSMSASGYGFPMVACFQFSSWSGSRLDVFIRVYVLKDLLCVNALPRECEYRAGLTRRDDRQLDVWVVIEQRSNFAGVFWCFCPNLDCRCVGRYESEVRIENPVDRAKPTGWSKGWFCSRNRAGLH